MIPFIIRQATLQDLDRIMEMEHSIFASEAFSRRQYRHLLQSATCRILLCESGADLAAMVVTGWRARTGHLWIYSIAVSGQMRGQGLGKRMIEECLEIARELQKPWIVLEVRVGNETAIRLYHKFGFEEVDFLAGYYGDGQDALRMALRVSPEDSSKVVCRQSDQTGLPGTST
jgi:ribosomal-protein-alanine N-acetyltransferase